MHITLDQARALDAFSRAGSLQGAAKLLRKGHTGVLYALKQLETQTGLHLFDRTGYRTRLTAAGEEVLRRCRALLEAERALLDTCTELRSGWEPTLRVVFDAIVPLGPVLEVIRLLREAAAPTRVLLSVDTLGGVERRFDEEGADVMLSILPVAQEGLVTVPLPKLRARLVAHRTHPLARARRVTPEALHGHTLLTVRGSDPRLHLSTGRLEQQSTVHLSDFHAKKAAIVAGIGFGWLPDWLIERELRRGELVPLSLTTGSVHVFEPRLSHRGRLGPAGERLRAHLVR